MRLRTKFAIVLLVTTLILSGVAVWSVEDFKRQTLAQERTDVRQTADLAAEQLDETVRNLRDQVRFYAAQPRAENFSRSDAILSEFVNSPRFFSARIVDRNGTVVDYRGTVDPERRSRMVGKDHSNRTYVQRALDGETYVRPPERRSDGSLVVLVSAPIGLDRDVEGGADGVFAGAFRVRDSRLFGGVRPLETDQQGVEITGRLAGGERATLYASNRTYANAMTATASVDEVDDVDWTVRVERDRSGLSRRLAWLRLVQGAGLLLIVGTFGAIGVWEYRTNLRQTGRLLAGFEALSAGEYDHDLSLAAAEEWERIAAGFNDLAAGLREREQAIRDREQRLSVLNRVLRHNLQNDLSVVQGHAELIADADSQERVETAVREIHAMIDELMGHSRTARKIEDAMDVAEKGVVEVDATVSAEAVAADANASYPAATVRTDLPDETPVWTIAALEHALESLVENAIEHNHSDEPVVEISVTRDGEVVRLTVADNGPGIPEHERAVLGRDEETALEHGSGLGLWLAHWVAEKSGGELVFGDQSDGGRATIVLAAASVDRQTVEEQLSRVLR